MYISIYKLVYIYIYVYTGAYDTRDTSSNQKQINTTASAQGHVNITATRMKNKMLPHFFVTDAKHGENFFECLALDFHFACLAERSFTSFQLCFKGPFVV